MAPNVLVEIAKPAPRRHGISESHRFLLSAVPKGFSETVERASPQASQPANYWYLREHTQICAIPRQMNKLDHLEILVYQQGGTATSHMRRLPLAACLSRPDLYLQPRLSS
jgi:hypothetical protein